MAQQLWLVSLPNRGDSPEVTMGGLQASLVKSGLAKVHKFDIPNLVVGTLDSLVASSDDLLKLNNQVENVVRKVERQYLEVAGSDGEALRVNETPVDTYLRNFQWDFARYRFQGRQLSEIVSQIQSMVGNVDEELKKLVQSYGDKQQALSGLQRKKTANLLTADFEDVLKPEEVAKLEFLNSDTLLTVVIVVPSQLEADFVRNYTTLGSDIASYGGPDYSDMHSVGKNDGKFGPALGASRVSVKGSPVAPESLVKITTEGDLSMYSLVVLKGQYEAGTYVNDEFEQGTFVTYLDKFKLVCREKKLMVREWKYESSESGGLDGHVERAKMELQQSVTTMVRWCKAHFGEVYSGWMHLKVIRGFAESVLRYGLPVDFLATFIEPNMKKEKLVLATLTKTVCKIRPELTIQDVEQDGDMGADEEAEALPFVCQKFNVIGHMKA